MRIRRRELVRLAVATATAPAVSCFAWAQPYPTRSVRLIVGFPAGGASDITSRLVGQYLSDRLGQPFIIENRPGAAANIATEAVVRASPDGHTLLLVGAWNTINATLYEKLSFNFASDIVPVAGIMRVPQVMLVNPSLPLRSLPEFISYAKVNPSSVNFASGGNGTAQHLCGELFKMLAGVNMTHVPYRGGAPALTDLIGGQVQMMFSPMPECIEYIRAEKVRALAVTTATRSEALPDVPTVGEFVQGYEASTWFGIGAPKKTPTEIIEKINKTVNMGLTDPKLQARLADLGGGVLVGSAADLSNLITEEIEKWSKVIHALNLRAE